MCFAISISKSIMLHFSEKYFETETRDGFTVNELMKRSWAGQLEVLGKIIQICEKHNIQYFAYYGTLLGAVRHKGFIPWDDDLDIAMKRDDYIKFLSLVREELPGEYCVLNAYTEDEYTNVFTRITNGHGISFSEEYLEKYHGCPFVVGVDIFPLYFITKDGEQAAAQKTILKVLGNAVEVAKSTEDQNAVWEIYGETLAQLEAITGYSLDRNKSLRTQLTILFDQICRWFTEEESDSLTVFVEYMEKGFKTKKEWFAESIQIPFENLMITVPKDYHFVLEEMFPNYMVPRIERDTHEYPFYKEQLSILGNTIEKWDWDWKAQQNMEITRDWEKLIEGKRVILYHTSADALMRYNEYAMDKLRNIFAQAKERKDIILWWIPCLFDAPNVRFVEKVTPQLLEGYKQLLAEYCSNQWGVCDLTGDFMRGFSMADSYYGDESRLAQLFRKEGKTVVIQDYETDEILGGL